MLIFWASLFLPFFVLSGSDHNPLARESQVLASQVDPKLIGPDNLCVVFSGVIGTYSAGGNPNTDVYSWLVTDPGGKEVFNRSGGAQFETIKVSFTEIGIYTLSLNIRRNNSIIYTENLRITVQRGPELAILPDYLLCGDSPAELTAIDPATPNLSQYTFNWTDVVGNPVGNTNSISVKKEGFYKIELFLRTPSGQPACVITGSTYVGPSLDYEINLSKTQLCQGESLTLATDTPLAGEWFVIKPGNTTRISLGNAFGLELKPEELEIPGTYTIIFSAKDPNYPECNSERKTNFEVVTPPKLGIFTVTKPDNCAKPNGAFNLTAQSPLDSVSIVETGFLATTVSAGKSFSFSSLEPQLYTIEAVYNGCRFITLFNLEAKNPPIVNSSTPDIELPETIIQAESCSEAGIVAGGLEVRFAQGKVNGEYRILSPNSGVVQQGIFTAQEKVSISLEGGTYLLELKVEGCTYPVETIVVPSRPQVAFTNPARITICQSFDFIPETEQNLRFTLKFPDQTEQTAGTGEAFTLTQSGDYELLGIPADASSGLCPRLEKFTATLAGEFGFEVILLEEDCFGNQVYKADIQGLPSDQTSIRWLNATGEIVGRNPLYFPTSVGNHSLIVQPLQSGFCPLTPIAFTIDPPVLAVNVDLEASKICPDPNTAVVTLLTDESAVERVDWIYFNDQGDRRNLPEFSNLFEITIDRVGSYEAVVYNRIGCEIGRNFIQVEKSTLLTPPSVEDLYGICVKRKQGPEINPGDFAKYEWYFNENLVSTASAFSPIEVGEYTLLVTTRDGCEFVSRFTTYDACSFDYTFPNAMVLDEPFREFEVWISKGITEIELFILNRQGALVHYEQATELAFERPIFKWDGKNLGKPIPPGTYAVVLLARNPLYSFEEKITGSLLVIE